MRLFVLAKKYEACYVMLFTQIQDGSPDADEYVPEKQSTQVEDSVAPAVPNRTFQQRISQVMYAK